MNNIKDTFDTIKASDDLKNSTKDYIYTELESKNTNTHNITRKFIKYAISFTVLIVIASYAIHLYNSYKTPVAYISINNSSNSSSELTNSASAIQIAVNKSNTIVEAIKYPKNDNSISEKDTEKLNLKNKELYSVFEQLLEQYNISYANISIISDNNETYIERLNELAERVGIQKEKINYYSYSIQEFKGNSITEIQDIINSKLKKLEELNDELDKLNSERQKLQNTIQESQNNIKYMEDMINNSSINYKAPETLIDELHNKIINNQSMLEEINKRIQDTNTQIE